MTFFSKINFRTTFIWAEKFLWKYAVSFFLVQSLTSGEMSTQNNNNKFIEARGAALALKKQDYCKSRCFYKPKIHGKSYSLHVGHFCKV